MLRKLCFTFAFTLACSFANAAIITQTVTFSASDFPPDTFTGTPVESPLNEISGSFSVTFDDAESGSDLTSTIESFDLTIQSKSYTAADVGLQLNSGSWGRQFRLGALADNGMFSVSSSAADFFMSVYFADFETFQSGEFYYGTDDEFAIWFASSMSATITTNSTPVNAPSSIFLIGLALIGAIVSRRRKIIRNT